MPLPAEEEAAMTAQERLARERRLKDQAKYAERDLDEI